MVGGGALASNKMQRTYVRVFFDRGKGEAFPSTCVGPSFGFRATQMRFRKSNEKYIFHPIRLGVTGITFTDSIAAVLRRYHVRRLTLYYKAKSRKICIYAESKPAQDSYKLLSKWRCCPHGCRAFPKSNRGGYK